MKITNMPIPSHNPHNNRWQIHFSLFDPASYWRSVWEWCWATFGDPETDTNDCNYHGGWLYFYNEKCVTMYLLRWA